jgi:DNA-binding LacI/PurR family transcriptional regulator
VSTATVSRVLNGRAGVSDSTRERVIGALDALGYERPLRLRSKSKGLIGLIVPELENPIFPMFAQVISGALARGGYMPLLCPRDAAGIGEDDYVEMLLDHQAAGIIFISGLHADATSSPLRYQRLVSANLPIVLINGFTPEVDTHFISDDDTVAIELVTGHLTALGHRQIGLACGALRFTPMRRRADAFKQWWRQAGLDGDPDEAIRTSLLTVEGGQAAAGDLMDAGFTAIVCGSDSMALGALRAAHARGLSVPEDLSVVGYDDSALMGYTHPALTTVRQSVLAMGQAAVSILTAESSDIAHSAREMLFRPELIVRDSTGLNRR